LDGHLVAHIRIDPVAVALYEQQYSRADIRIQRAHSRGLVLPGNVFVDPPEAVSERELRGSEIWNEFLRPNNVFYRLVGIMSVDGITINAITFMRPSTKPVFGGREIKILQCLMPHLQRATQLCQHLAELQTHAKAAMNALDAWWMGWLLVDRAARVLACNHTAQVCLDRRDGLAVSNGCLVTGYADDTCSLHMLIRNAQGSSAPTASTMVTRRHSRKKSLEVMILPVQWQSRLYTELRAAAMLFVHDSELERSSQPDILRTLYGLTRVEAGVADAVAQGKTLRMIADELEITLYTARDHLKHIFEKTGVHRQAELTRLLLTGLAQAYPPFKG
jgi:DNA-binding CsgD family transcriptional regulator